METKRVAIVLCVVVLLAALVTAQRAIPRPAELYGSDALLDGYCDEAQYFIDAFTLPSERLTVEGSASDVTHSLATTNETGELLRNCMNLELNFDGLCCLRSYIRSYVRLLARDDFTTLGAGAACGATMHSFVQLILASIAIIIGYRGSCFSCSLFVSLYSIDCIVQFRSICVLYGELALRFYLWLFAKNSGFSIS